MIKCKEATNTQCGKNCCCWVCEEEKNCTFSDKCSFVEECAETCENAYTEDTVLVEMQTETAAVIKAIADLTIQKKAIEDQEKKMRAELLAAMEKYGVKEFQTDTVKFTYVAPTTRTTIDSAKLKKEKPDIAEKYSKTSSVSASVRITIK